MNNGMCHVGHTAPFEVATATCEADICIQTNDPACHMACDSESGKAIDPDVEESNGLFIPRLNWVPLR
jgi:hypothetical protein